MLHRYLQHERELRLGILDHKWYWFWSHLAYGQRNHFKEFCRRSRGRCFIAKRTEYHLFVAKGYSDGSKTGKRSIRNGSCACLDVSISTKWANQLHKLQIAVVNIEMPNIHYYPFDISKFPKVVQGENKEVFHPVDKPNGNIFSQLARVDLGLKAKL